MKTMSAIAVMLLGVSLGLLVGGMLEYFYGVPTVTVSFVLATISATVLYMVTLKEGNK